MSSSAPTPIVLQFGKVGDCAWHEVTFNHKEMPTSLQWYTSTKPGKDAKATAPPRVYSNTTQDLYRSGQYTTRLKEKFEQEQVEMRTRHSVQSIEAYGSASISSDIAPFPADPNVRSADITQLMSWRETYLSALRKQYGLFVAETIKKPDFGFACNDDQEPVSVWLLRALATDHADRTDDEVRNHEQTLLESLLQVADTPTAIALWTKWVKRELDFYPSYMRQHD